MPESRDNGRMLPVAIKLACTGSSVVTEDVVVAWIPACAGMTGSFTTMKGYFLCVLCAFAVNTVLKFHTKFIPREFADVEHATVQDQVLSLDA